MDWHRIICGLCVGYCIGALAELPVALITAHRKHKCYRKALRRSDI
jgi:hypothetical protein